MSNIVVKWPEWNKLVNKSFLPLVDNKDRYLILYGGRGSSKSDFVAKKLVYRCINEPYFKCILVRNTYNSIRDTSYQTLKDTIIGLGLSNLFVFKLNPLEIVCKNGNSFIARGCDDVMRMKSIKDPTAAWYEEDIISESDWYTVSTSIRTLRASYLQEIFSINPECEGDFQLNWFWKRFFDGRNQLSFSDKVTVEVDENRFVDLTYTVHHSTYKDNKWITAQFVAALEDMRRTDPYYFQVYCMGRWGQRIRSTAAYKKFSMRNVIKKEYNKDLPLWLSFDFNVLPGVSCGIFQVDGKHLHMINEIQLSPPRNSTKAVCQEIIRLYQGHAAGMFVTGDPAGKHRDTRDEQGFNDYDLILGLLTPFKAAPRVQRAAPPVVARMNFINTLFESGFQGITFTLDECCNKAITDLLNGQESGDGTKLKEKYRDPKTGATIEKYHHFSDLIDYLVITIYYSEYKQYLQGGRKSNPITFGKNAPSKNTYDSPKPIKPIPKRQSKNDYI